MNTKRKRADIYVNVSSSSFHLETFHPPPSQFFQKLVDCEDVFYISQPLFTPPPPFQSLSVFFFYWSACLHALSLFQNHSLFVHAPLCSIMLDIMTRYMEYCMFNSQSSTQIHGEPIPNPMKLHALDVITHYINYYRNYIICPKMLHPLTR